MSRVCEICGKRPSKGNSIARTGLPKKTGGFGLKTTGITRRTFYPNLQVVKVKVNGGVRRMRICTKCLKKGKVEKA
ncbi:MAG: 50S ribosomal protein L28 [Planctomycetota bacterium]|nr:MAG: 50S ribosomal protein L28 [Planctomycetota bacterium]